MQHLQLEESGGEKMAKYAQNLLTWKMLKTKCQRGKVEDTQKIKKKKKPWMCLWQDEAKRRPTTGAADVINNISINLADTHTNTHTARKSVQKFCPPPQPQEGGVVADETKKTYLITLSSLRRRLNYGHVRRWQPVRWVLSTSCHPISAKF